MGFKKLVFILYFTRIEPLFPWASVFPGKMTNIKMTSKISSDHKDAITALGS